SSQEMSTSLGLIVKAPGTSAISSKPYAARALRPRPTHIPIRTPPSVGPRRLPRAPYVELRQSSHTVFSGQYTDTPVRCQPLGGRSTPPRLEEAAGSYREGVGLLPDHPQPLQPEVRIHLMDATRALPHQPGHAT